VAAILSLRPFLSSDRFVLNRWLGTPHVVTWFGSRAAAEAEMTFAQSSPSSLCRIILLDGAAIGYAQAFDLGLTGGTQPEGLPAGSFDSDVFIGATEQRGKGYGAAALGLLRDEVFSSTFASSLGVVVAIRNESAVRMIERAGFQWVSVWHDVLLGPCWVMRALRPHSR
jgi:RimJ/RimL family protein N-acetyltransferase